MAKKLKKVGVVVGNCPGFVGTRMFLPYMREAQFLTEEGATPWHVDQVLYDWGMAMGIFAVDDMAGIDIGWKVREAHKARQKQGIRVPLVVDKLYAMRRLGQKTGRGWYLYGDDRARSADPEVEALIEQTAAAAGIPRRTITDEEIIERCIYVMVNEGARILEEGHALRANDIDVVFLAGYGFPAYRGGPMWYADTVGLQNVYRRIVEFHRRHGELWEPAPLLKRLAEKGKTFASFDKDKMESMYHRCADLRMNSSAPFRHVNVATWEVEVKRATLGAPTCTRCSRWEITRAANRPARRVGGWCARAPVSRRARSPWRLAHRELCRLSASGARYCSGAARPWIVLGPANCRPIRKQYRACPSDDRRHVRGRSVRSDFSSLFLALVGFWQAAGGHFATETSHGVCCRWRGVPARH